MARASGNKGLLSRIYAAPKSLDRSAGSVFVIDNLSVMWLTAAASTQPFDSLRCPN